MNAYQAISEMPQEEVPTFRSRCTIVLYIIFLGVTLSPAMFVVPRRMSPPAGQSEVEQNMDNVTNRPPIIHKRTSRSVLDEYDIQKLSAKTSSLLSVAEELLKSLPLSNERLWIESFVAHMEDISKLIERTSHHKTPKNVSFAKDVKVPDDRPKEPPQPVAAAVRENIPVLISSGAISKYKMPIPEVNTVFPDDHAELPSLPKPVSLTVSLTTKTRNIEEDALVHQLENLHVRLDDEILSENTNIANEDPTTPTTPTNTFAFESMDESFQSRESQKAKVMANIAEQVKEYHRLGGIMPQIVLDYLYDEIRKNAVPARNFRQFGMKRSQGMVGMNDVSDKENNFAVANLENIPPYPNQLREKYKVGDNFPINHPNMVQDFPQHSGNYLDKISPMNKAKFYQGNFPFAATEYPTSYQRMVQDFDVLRQQSRFPRPLNKNLLHPHMSYNQHVPPPNFYNRMRHGYAPIPEMHTWDPQSSANRLPQMMAHFPVDQPRIGTEMNDDLKRELRDGKIIVMSDSVLRSNFQRSSTEATEESTTAYPGSRPKNMMDENTTGI